MLAGERSGVDHGEGVGSGTVIPIDRHAPRVACRFDQQATERNVLRRFGRGGLSRGGIEVRNDRALGRGTGHCRYRHQGETRDQHDRPMGACMIAEHHQYIPPTPGSDRGEDAVRVPQGTDCEDMGARLVLMPRFCACDAKTSPADSDGVRPATRTLRQLTKPARFVLEGNGYCPQGETHNEPSAWDDTA